MPHMYLFGIRTLSGARYVFICTKDARWCPICIYLDDGCLVVPDMYLFGLRTFSGARHFFFDYGC